jgi:hypothetical protein
MCEVSREASTACAAGLTRELGRPALFACGPLEVLDMLVCDGLGDGGVHGSFLSSWSTLESTSIRVS